MYIYEKEIQATEVSPGVFRKVLAYNDDIMVVQFLLKKGASLDKHAHDVHTQTTYLVSGKMQYDIGGDIREVGPGTSMLMEKGEAHGVTALEDTTVIDVVTPARKDFL